MKRTLYFAAMSLLVSIIVGAIVVNVVNMMYPDFGLSIELGIGFFFALTWSVLSVCGLFLGHSTPGDSSPNAANRVGQGTPVPPRAQ